MLKIAFSETFYWYREIKTFQSFARGSSDRRIIARFFIAHNRALSHKNWTLHNTRHKRDEFFTLEHKESRNGTTIYNNSDF